MNMPSGNVPSWVEHVDTPALVIHLDRVRNHIETMQRWCRDGGKLLRPHIKTHKLPQLARMQVEAGATGITCAKLGEAEVMQQAGLENIFIAYPLWGKIKWQRLAILARNVDVRVCVESEELARALSTALTAEDVEVEVCIKIDTGLGRTGLRDSESVAKLARLCEELPALRFVGIYTHEGQAYASIPEPAGIPAIAEEAVKQMCRHRDAIVSAGIACPVVSVGSTIAAKWMAKAEGITEMRPGAYVYRDHCSVAAGLTEPEDVALSVVTTVVSRPAPDRVIVDGGLKTFSSDRYPFYDGYAVPRWRDDLMIDRCSEEHGMCTLDPPGASPRVGERVVFYPLHCCGTANMWNQAIVLDGDEIVDTWPIRARGLVQ